MGWSQGAVVLHELGAPISVRWGLEVSEDTFDMQKIMQPSLQYVRCVEDIPTSQEAEQNQYMLHADIRDTWWLRMFQTAPVNTWTVSAPCQPWSVAGRESGLQSCLGRLQLLIVDLAAAFEPDMVLFEQVSGFATHQDNRVIMQAWNDAGYVIVWKATLELGQVMPCNRNRHLLVMRRRSQMQPAITHTMSWGCKRATTLGSVKAVFDLPWSLLSEHVPAPPVLAMYLSPDFMPKCPQMPSIRPEKYRIKTPSDTAGCFLAQYGFAHHLPQDLLRAKGLFGSLLSQGCLTRYFSVCEVASLHCAVLPVLCSHNRRLSMKLLGNSIAVPHAAVTMLKGCQAAGFMMQCTVRDVLDKCMEPRLHNNNSALIPYGHDWILCHADQAFGILKTVDTQPVPKSLLALTDLLQPVTLCTPVHQYEVWLSPATPWQQSLEALGYPAATVSSLCLQVCPDGDFVQVPFQPLLPGTEDERHYVKQKGLMVIWSATRTAVVPAQSPSHFVRLAVLAADDIADDEAPSYVARASGCPISGVPPLPPIVLILPERQLPELFALTCFAAFGGHCILSTAPDLITIAVPARHAQEVWLGWPIAHLVALGWQTAFQPQMPDGDEPMQVSLRPMPDKVRVTVEGLLQALVCVGMASRLQSVQEQPFACQMIDVEVQIVAYTIWKGRIPSEFQLDLLQRWWHDLASATKQAAEARLLSGPYLLPLAMSVGQLCAGVVSSVKRKTGPLLLSLHPLYCGGGNKEESKQWAMTKLASLLLTQGVELATTTHFVDVMLEAVGAPKIVSMMSEGNDLKKWDAVCELAKSRDIPLPEAAQGHAKAEARTRKAAAKSRVQQPRLRAADLRVEPGFFVNADGTPAVLLEALTPGATGLYVIEPEQASELVETLRGVQADELALLIVGQSVDDTASASTPVSFPALTGEPPARVLIAGRLCNLGGRSICAKHTVEAEVQLQDSMCCQFLMFHDELEPDQWAQVVQAPVRFAAETFKQSGIQRPFTSPWARNFTQKGRPTAPATADLATFHARIDSSEAEAVLKASGHNKIYVVPKSWNHQPHASYAVIWTGSSKADVVRAAMQTGDQCGIARNKGRYGLRVHESHHARVFALLNPGRTAPQRIAISAMHKAGPFPQQAGAEDIRAWALKLNWEVRVMKALGAAHWLLGTSHDPPGQYMAFNGQTVLLTPVKARAQQVPTVQSGTLPRSAQPMPAAAAQLSEDPWLHNDPWKAYRKPQQPPVSASRPNLGPPPGLGRNVTGPTDARFQEQDCRIVAIEEGLKELRQQTETRHQQLQADRQADSEQQKATVSELRGQMHSMSQEFSRQLQQSVESLQGAQAQQMQQVIGSVIPARSPVLVVLSDNRWCILVHHMLLNAGKGVSKESPTCLDYWDVGHMRGLVSLPCWGSMNRAFGIFLGVCR